MESEQHTFLGTKRVIFTKFFIFNIGIFFNFSGFLVFLFLQSSVNIEDGLGAASVTATYATSAVVGITVTPLIIRAFGPKNCLILSEFTYCLFILVNYYPVPYTLLPASVVVGIGEATMWPVMSLFCVYFARQIARYNSKEPAKYVVQFIGSFYFVCNLSGVFGHLINFAILYGGQSSNSSQNNDSSISSASVRDLSICGRNDCQNPNTTNENIDTYVPAEKVLVYILIGVMGGLVVFAMFIHGFFMTKIDSRLEEHAGSENIQEDKKTSLRFAFSTLKHTLSLMIRPKQLLITPFALYSGIVLGFTATELPRAFGSCVFGVEKVGLCLALMKGSDAVAALISCKVSSKTNRHIPMITGFCIDLVNYTICLLWIPTESSLWVVYIVFILSGASDGHWQPLVNEIFCSYFPGEEDIALAVWNFHILVGIAWQAGWSTTLCIYTKIYFQIALFLFAVICYGISQLVYYRKKPKGIESKYAE